MNFIEAMTLFGVMAGLAALPSSSAVLVVARSASAGVRNGIATAVGIVFGDLLFVTLAFAGLSAAAELMGAFFSVLKVIGGLYLVWIGIRLLKAKAGLEALIEPQQSRAGLLVSLSAGFLLTLGDLKAVIFYASLLPLFVDLQHAVSTDYLLVMGITITSVGIVKIAYAIFAAQIAQHLQQRTHSTLPQKLAGGALVTVGSYVAIKP